MEKKDCGKSCWFSYRHAKLLSCASCNSRMNNALIRCDAVDQKR